MDLLGAMIISQCSVIVLSLRELVLFITFYLAQDGSTNANKFLTLSILMFFEGYLLLHH